ncbi:hypothetical protein [Microbacterium enclense]|uniref:hypothetical protein n=1 Tax=Microbacterium enclense TaxID=993073 RepID=UPI003F7FDC72
MGGVTGTTSESPGALSTRARWAHRWRAAFAALLCVSIAVFCALTAIVFFASTAGYTDEGEEGYAIAIASALTLLALGLCTGAAISLRGLGTMPAAASSSLTIAVTLIWVGVTIAAYLAGATSGAASNLVTTTGLTIPAALVGFLGVVATTVVGRHRA